MTKSIRNVFILAVLCLNVGYVYSQSIGDTIRVKVLDYSTNTRDTMVQFPVSGQFEKIIMNYNMRCKGGQISTSQDRNRGCGEWDYSCNTFIVDSNKIENRPSVHPDHIITNFSGDEFFYTDKPTYDIYRYTQQVPDVTINTEQVFDVVSGMEEVELLAPQASLSNKSLILYTADELLSSGLTAGSSIDAIELELLSQDDRLPFFQIRAAQVNNDSLSPQILTGLTWKTLSNMDMPFIKGSNKIQFHEKIIWDGSSAVIFEMSYTNRKGQSGLTFSGIETNKNQAMFASNNYSVDLNHGGNFEFESPYLDSIEEAITISLRTYGNPDLLPRNTTVLYGYDENRGDRDLNIHLPWSNSQVYFDCGFDEGYDRINTEVNTDDFEGRWNHWVFTKNAGPGNMTMYVNGKVVSSAGSKHNSIHLEHLIIGSDHNGNNPYPGSISQLAIWNRVLNSVEREMAASERIDEGHPLQDGLVTYFRFSEGQGNQIVDDKYGIQANGNNIVWNVERGVDIYRDFQFSTLKPSLKIYSGDYVIAIKEEFAFDSVQRAPNLIRQYDVVDHSGMLKHDELVVIDEYYLFETQPNLFYDGETGLIYDGAIVDTAGSLLIGDLNYFNRYPYYNEIMSFVTPYGIGLDLGLDGETWSFDVSDYAPILKGNKRMLLSMGGQNQEEMDIEFLFITGTPPRDVLDFNQLWQGATSRGSANINAIRQNNRYAPVMVEIPAEAEFVKMRSTITGHGAEGEFHQNGGPITHALNVNGGVEEFSWDITEECSENPIFPQGGTWVYDRQGWCPGAPSLTKVSDFTDFVTAGDSAEFDYSISEPINPGGDYRYIIAHQLVSYGGANHTKDAAIHDVRMPSSNIVYSRINPICGNPVVTIQNRGAEPLYNLDIDYWVDDRMPITYSWTGDLKFMETQQIELPSEGVFKGLIDHHDFHVRIATPDEYEFNDRMTTRFEAAVEYSNIFIFRVATNNFPQENSYVIYDEGGNVMLNQDLPLANTVYQDTISKPGCYRLEFLDTGGDGLSWWANTAQGSGSALIRHPLGITLKSFQPDFGGKFTYSFSIAETVNTDAPPVEISEIKVSPNPSNGMFVASLKNADKYKYRVFDGFGHSVMTRINAFADTVEIFIENAFPGVYYLEITDGEQNVVKKIIIL